MSFEDAAFLQFLNYTLGGDWDALRTLITMSTDTFYQLTTFSELRRHNRQKF